jgi:L-asparagine transporter-like permease
MVSSAGILIAAAMSKVTPKAFTYLFGIALFGAIIVWIVILLSHLSFRRRHPPDTLPVKMPLFPYMQIAGLVLLLAVLVTMGLEKDWSLSWICGVPWLGLLTIAYLAWKRRARLAEAQDTPLSAAGASALTGGDGLPK